MTPTNNPVGERREAARMNAHSRELFAPTPEEIQAACEVLLRVEPMNSEARKVVRDRYASAFRDAAKGFLRTAREYRDMGRPEEVARMVKNARWHWRHYLMEMI